VSIRLLNEQAGSARFALLCRTGESKRAADRLWAVCRCRFIICTNIPAQLCLGDDLLNEPNTEKDPLTKSERAVIPVHLTGCAAVVFLFFHSSGTNSDHIPAILTGFR